MVDVLERRWVEIVDGASLTGVLHYPECFSDKFKNRLDDRIIELSGSLLPSELVQVSKQSITAEMVAFALVVSSMYVDTVQEGGEEASFIACVEESSLSRGQERQGP